MNHAAAGAFPLVSGGRAACIYVDTGSVWLVRHAAELFQKDIENVTGVRPEILGSPAEANGRPLIIVATANGPWESFRISVEPGIMRITGADRRGTAYGIFELSRQMGVSPWYWWGDVPVKHQETLYIRKGGFSSPSPSVKYRGIFINDEAPAFSGWARQQFGGINHQAYEKIFELLLRLKANYLWPAMWGSAFNDDDKLSPVAADQWGIVMGTSHHEPMLRAQQEWKRYGSGPWDYTKNDSVLRAFWRTGIQHMGRHESIVTIGMRGDGDMPMTGGTATRLLEGIVGDQRAIIEQVTGRPARETPQLWALYKEVQDYYDKGMRVPDDVTLLLCDDNWGNIRKLPRPGSPARTGGYGIYYHFDYVGGPRNYKWINTNNLARVWEQMHLAYAYDARQIWIVNVGDLKPMELPISFFLDYAWHAGEWGDQMPVGYYARWALEQFGAADAEPIGSILSHYAQWASRRKPELLDANSYSIDAFVQMRAGWDSLEAKAEAIGQKLAPAYADAYFELVLHPVKAYANLFRLYAAVALNRYYAGLQDARANGWADEAARCFGQDSLISAAYHRLAGGKWNHMMDQTHIGYTGWQEPRVQVMPAVERVSSAEAARKLPDAHKSKAPIIIPATHFDRKTEGNGIHWQVIPGIGRDGDGITTFPVTAAFDYTAPGAPGLSYHVNIRDTGVLQVAIYCSPTLNFLHDSAGLQYGVSLDGGPVQFVSINKEEGDTRAWEHWVANNCIVTTTPFRVTRPGRHTLFIRAKSPGIVLQKIGIQPTSKN